MCTKVFILVIAVISYGSTCHIRFSDDGSYTLSVQGDTAWLHSGPTSVLHGGQWRSTGDGSLKVNKTEVTSGEDELGAYSSNTVTLLGDDVTMEIEARSYGMLRPDTVVFVQRFPDGVTGSKFDANKTNTAFPAFNVTSAEEDVGYMSYGGMMLGDYSKSFGRWGPTADINDGMDGTGPLVLFNKNGSAMVISPFNNVMAASAWHDKESAILKYGIMGGVEEVPAGFELKTIAYCSQDGIGEAIAGWGSTLRFVSNKTDEVVKYHQSQDLSLTHLGYWTDNGAYYYYNTEKGMTYEQTLLELRDKALEAEIPYRYLQLDSWFYFKDNNKAVTMWDAMESVFPKGIEDFQKQLLLPLVAHNRYWSVNTTYAKQNGGFFDFVIGNNVSVPMDPVFWDFIMGHGREEWGLIVYEQDWLNVQVLFSELLNSNLTAGADWLTQMGRGARRHGLKIQYCMALPRQALYSMNIPEVTQARVSNDYQLQTDQWRIGVTSHLAAAVGVAPSKDTFWTSKEQPGNTYNKTEPYPTLQTIVAVLSRGPVGPGDKIGSTNELTLLSCCNGDGLILKPSKPARAVDDQIQELAFKEGTGAQGEVWTTYNNINDSLYGVVLAANLYDDYDLTPKRAGFLSAYGPQFTDGILYWVTGDNVTSREFGVGDVYNIDDDMCFDIDEIACLFYTSPYIHIRNHTIALLGDMDKWVPMSEQRVVSVWKHNTSLAVTLRGQPAEAIQFWYLLDGEVKTVIGEADDKGCVTLKIFPQSGWTPIVPVMDCRYEAPPITTPAPPTDPTGPPGGGATAVKGAWLMTVTSVVCVVLSVMKS